MIPGTTTPSRRKLSLHELTEGFADDYPEARTILVYRGRERLARDGVLCIPVEEFLLGLRPGSGIGD